MGFKEGTGGYGYEPHWILIGSGIGVALNAAVIWALRKNAISHLLQTRQGIVLDRHFSWRFLFFPNLNRIIINLRRIPSCSCFVIQFR